VSRDPSETIETFLIIIKIKLIKKNWILKNFKNWNIKKLK